MQHHLRDFCLRMVFMSRRKRSKLTAAQKTEIWKRWKAGQSLHEIGRAFDKPHTSIRHLLLPRGGIAPAALHRRLREIVASKLILEWSPEQISGWLKTEYPKDEKMRVSHETITVAYSSKRVE